MVDKYILFLLFTNKRSHHWGHHLVEALDPPILQSGTGESGLWMIYCIPVMQGQVSNLAKMRWILVGIYIDNFTTYHLVVGYYSHLSLSIYIFFRLEIVPISEPHWAHWIRGLQGATLQHIAPPSLKSLKWP